MDVHARDLAQGPGKLKGGEVSGEKPQDLVDPTAYAWGRRSGRSGDLPTTLKVEVSGKERAGFFLTPGKAATTPPTPTGVAGEGDQRRPVEGWRRRRGRVGGSGARGRDLFAVRFGRNRTETWVGSVYTVTNNGAT